MLILFPPFSKLSTINFLPRIQPQKLLTPLPVSIPRQLKREFIKEKFKYGFYLSVPSTVFPTQITLLSSALMPCSSCPKLDTITFIGYSLLTGYGGCKIIETSLEKAEEASARAEVFRRYP